ncbi:MAG: hypothetical protein H6607_13250 [Flavobacteriales bacterium]|nr:hypothetical protein [Flavobacteriales bacterium]
MKHIYTLFLLLSVISQKSLCQDSSASYYSGYDEWDDYFMPGIGYRSYYPINKKDLGVYNGFVTEFVIYARAKGKNKNHIYTPSPSRVKTYGNLCILNSTEPTAKKIFFSNIGINLSFEGRAQRKYCIPIFGLEVGGLYQRNFSTFQFSPTVGVQLLSNKKALLSIQGSKLYTNKLFDEYSGFTVSATFNVLLWN